MRLSMQADKISIENRDIDLAEKALLPNGQVFDDERRAFIKDLDTLDLQAVPGSGKTTALMAKLFILEKQLPFDDGSGILVLSHTNAAVDEIKLKLGKMSPQLFEYPSFIGTIQSFVDKYLAIPFYSHLYKKEHLRIDDEIFEERSKLFSNIAIPGFTREENNRAKQVLHTVGLNSVLRLSIEEGRIALATKCDQIHKPRGKIQPQNYTDWSEAEKQRVREWLFRFKCNLLRQGILCFNDAFILALRYLQTVPKIKDILQQRFHFVFVDEMQDMNALQYKVLEKLFSNNENSCFQRIGDKNQAIFNGEGIIEQIWVDRVKVRTLAGSLRLSPVNAKVVQPFGLNQQEILGRNQNSDGTEISIKPHLILFTDETIHQVLPQFVKLIKSFQRTKQIPSVQNQKFKAVGWRKEKENSTQLGIIDYYPEFSTIPKTQIDYTTLEGYLKFNIEYKKETLEEIRKNILNALLKILRFEKVMDQDAKHYTKRKLLNYLREYNPEEYEILKINIYRWSINWVKGNLDMVLTGIRGYIPELLGYFGKQIKDSFDFVNNSAQLVSEGTDVRQVQNTNIYKEGGVEIEVSTIHAAKGQTHTATLYLETFYQKKHESDRLCYCFFGREHCFTKTYDIQSIKMAYVGMSRPTHLLCCAVHKDRYDKYLSTIDRSKWEIIEL